MAGLPALVLKPGREKVLLQRHPWVFSGAVARQIGTAGNGDTVDVVSSRGDFLARAAYSPHSQIIARVWAWDEAEMIDEAFFQKKLADAVELRKSLIPEASTNALRLVHAESDGLPGLVVDRYGDTLVLQLLSAGVERWKNELVRLLERVTGFSSIYERSDVDVRKLEGLPPSVGPLLGPAPEDDLLIYEHDIRYHVQVGTGHKTGFYLDQRDNRMRVRSLAAEREVLDCFSYTGGFLLNALAGGAKHVTAVDASADALKRVRNHLDLNNMPGNRVEIVEADVFQFLRGYRDRARTFDLIILDPPKFAHTAAQARKAARGYKDINLLAIKLLRPQGILVTFSCSGGVNRALFQQIVAGAALDAGAQVRIVGQLSQGADHPVALNYPEGEYLKGLVLQRGR